MRDTAGQREGITFAALSYVIWGLLPIYWKLLEHVSAGEILANRVIWSFFFMLAILAAARKIKTLPASIKGLGRAPKQLVLLGLASILISTNWFVYIWAVNTGQVVEASLGYYINPLVSVLLGMAFFKEKLTRLQAFSFLLAFVGVLAMTAAYGRFPWIALLLAFSFGLYGVAKKGLSLDPAVGLTLETMLILPVAFLYTIYLYSSGSLALFTSLDDSLLLMGAGVATAVPLLLFAKGARHLSLSMLGFLQYIAPTLMLGLGVLLYGEDFSKTDLFAFMLIWVAVTLFSLSNKPSGKASLSNGKGRKQQIKKRA